MPQDSSYSPPLTRSQAKLRSRSLLTGIEISRVGKRAEATKRQPLRQLAVPHNENRETREELEYGESEVKKIRISEQEMQMNGAPEGDLFDITVKTDVELQQLPQIDNPAAALHEAVSRNSEVWADQFNDVETIRRIVLQNSTVIANEGALKCIELALTAASSLRSCHIRNGLLCLNGIFSLPTLRDAHPEVLSRLLSTLLTKSTTGPRFMMDLASTTLHTVAQAYSMSPLINALRPHLPHRNAEVSSKCIVLICSAIKLEAQHVTTATLAMLHECLSSAKRPVARDAVRQCLSSLQSSVGPEAFETLLKELSPTQLRDLNLELSKASSDSTSSKLSTSNFRKTLPSFNKFSKPIVATKSAPELKIGEHSS